MKKRFSALSFIVIIAMLTLQNNAIPVELSAGATTWYTAWDYEDDASSDVKYDPAFLYGPALSLAMTPDFSMSFVFLYGEFDMDTGSGTIPIKRFDSDLTLNYRTGNYFKIFAGAKYVGFTWEDDGRHRAFGPGAGISAVFPIGGNFFILGYLSGMYLIGTEDGDKSMDYKAEQKEYGFNSSLSLAYYLQAASTTISLGARYQQVNIDYDSTEDGMVSDSRSNFYGITLAAVYTLNI